MPIEEKVFLLAYFTRENLFFQKKTLNQRAKLIFSKWVKLLLYNFWTFSTSFGKKKMKLERRFDLEDRIWRFKFGKTQFSVLKLHFEKWIWKLVLFETLAFISLGFGRGAQVGKTPLLELKFITAQALTLGVFNFSFGTLQALGSNQNPRSNERRHRIFFTMWSEDSETAHLLGSGPVLRHKNACVRDVLTAPSNVYLNLGLNLFHSYF